MPDETNNPPTAQQLFEALYAITYAVQDLALDRTVNRYRSDKLDLGAFDFAERTIIAFAPPGEE